MGDFRVPAEGYVCCVAPMSSSGPRVFTGDAGRRGAVLTAVLALTYSLGRDRNGFKDNYMIIKCSFACSLYKDRDVFLVGVALKPRCHNS